MIIVLKAKVTETEINNIKTFIERTGARIHESEGTEKKIIGIIGDKRDLDQMALEALPGVSKVIRILEPYKLTSRNFHPKSTVVTVGDVRIGDLEPVIFAGPCSVETEEQIWDIAREMSEKKVQILRGGVFKPRSSPYAFQGVGEEGAKWLMEAGKAYKMPVISEVMEINDIDVLDQYVDIFQVGARNMQNFKLLKALGRTKKPIFLKRGIAATLNEFLMSAEYILSEGNDQVILCERGIRTFVEFSRNTFDLNIVPMIKNVSHLPIVIDPSHATGRTDLIVPVSLGGMVAGADGMMIEVHPRPYEAFSDGNQSLTYAQMDGLLEDWNTVREAVITLRKKSMKELEDNESNYSG
ncbi:MAG: 3-deoxy-7-phosphoheptulonate synthase [Calditrichales bacterium]|nr:MAG: 3-deoxy-7-phosphoheptulonate synthase [Calditrichales bacterium]